jgi:hypothetical protein
MWAVALSVTGLLCGVIAHRDTSVRRHVPHLVMALSMVAMAAHFEPFGPGVWFVTLIGTAIWFAHTDEPRAVRTRSLYDLGCMAVLVWMMPMPGMPVGGAGVLAAAVVLAGKLGLAIWHAHTTRRTFGALERLGDITMGVAMGLMVL